MSCQHDNGDLCIVCDEACNVCCGDERECDKCSAVTCIDCLKERKNVCPSCTNEIITDDKLINFLLEKLSTSRHDVEAEIRSNFTMPKSEQPKTYLNTSTQPIESENISLPVRDPESKQTCDSLTTKGIPCTKIGQYKDQFNYHNYCLTHWKRARDDTHARGNQILEKYFNSMKQ